MCVCVCVCVCVCACGYVLARSSLPGNRGMEDLHGALQRSLNVPQERARSKAVMSILPLPPAFSCSFSSAPAMRLVVLGRRRVCAESLRHPMGLKSLGVAGRV